MKGDSRYKRINHSTHNILLGTKRTKLNSARRRAVKRNPYGDFDRDGVINSYDCSPYNKNQQGWFSDAWSNVKSFFTPQKETTTITETSAATITGGASIGGYITGGSTDVYTPSVPTGGTTYNWQGTPISTTTYDTSGKATTIPVAPPSNIVTKKEDILGVGILTGNSNQQNLDRTSQLDLGTVPKSETGSRVNKATSYLLGLLNPNLRNKKYQEPLTQVDVSSQLPYQRGGTENKNYVPTTEDMTRLQYYEQAGQQKLDYFGFTQQLKLDAVSNDKAKEIRFQMEANAKKEIQDYFDKVQSDVDKGKVSAEDGQKMIDIKLRQTNATLKNDFVNQYNNAMSSYVQSANDVTKAEADKILKDVVKNVDKRDAPYVFLSSSIVGAGIGLVSTLLPPVGYALSGVGAVNLLTGEKGKLAAKIKEQPYSFAAGLGGGIAGGIGGMMLGRNIIGAVNTARVNNYLAQKNLKIDDIQRQYSVSVGKAIKLGKDANGNTIWQVESNGVTKFINKNNGKLIDSISSKSMTKVVASNSEGAMKAVIEGWGISFKQSGWKFNILGNRIKVDLGASRVTGSALVKPIGKNIYEGTGTYDIRLGKGKLNIGNIASQKYSTNIKFEPYTRYSSTSNFVTKMLGRRATANIYAGEKWNGIVGVEDFYKTKAVTDIGTNILKKTVGVKNVKLADIYYLPKPKTAPLPTRDVSATWYKSIYTKLMGGGNGNLLQSGGGGSNVLKNIKTNFPTDVLAKTVTETSQKASMMSVANEFSKAVVGSANKAVLNTWVIPSTNAAVTSNVLIESNYPSYVGGSQVTRNFYGKKDKYNFGLGGGTATGMEEVLFGKTITKTKQEDLISQNQFFTPIEVQIQEQQQQQQQRQIQKPKLDQKIFTPLLPKYGYGFYVPPFTGLPYYQKSKGYYYGKKRSTRTKEKKTAYASSVAAYQLGITMPKRYNVKQKFTGLEIRPLQYNKQPLITPSYLKRIKNMYSAKGMKKQNKKIRKQGKGSKGVSKKINKFLLGG